ncbi:fumarylacetoacetate hydrolase family protein [Parahaliea mediterranea]|uniref:fumarylacetoacetate hydrolase family protein n=1 Tax=Parahaliea mediterranea TaxID=651086 RepID=UPI000E2EC913|nr:fumarylacetoacetate hydrolase family protein [Parahaliea mediterranea]
MWYALATYETGAGTAPALVLGDTLYDLAQCWRDVEGAAPPAWAASVGQVIATGCATTLAQLASAASTRAAAGQLQALPVDARHLPAPYTPPRIFGTASNYIEHAAEMNTLLAAKSESSPYIFMKASTSVIGTGATVLLPPETEKPDWEVELGVVIGRGGRRIRKEDALAHIAGYTVVNDVSARDMNRRSDYPFKHDWFRGKSWDTFCPMGPWFVPAACVADPHNLSLHLSLNGEPMQDGNTSELIWNIFEQIEYLSSILTLQSGDLIMTGTPAGVGMGRGLFLKAGDVMEARVGSVGTIRNPVAAEAIEHNTRDCA